MEQQCEMLFARRDRADEVWRRILLELLETRGRWMSAKEILSSMGLPQEEGDKRWLRGLASESDGWVLSGQLGYRHIAHASADEIGHASAWLEHQAKIMGDRACAIRRRAHGLIR